MSVISIVYPVRGVLLKSKYHYSSWENVAVPIVRPALVLVRAMAPL
jgi:hypothetical protein